MSDGHGKEVRAAGPCRPKTEDRLALRTRTSITCPSHHRSFRGGWEVGTRKTAQLQPAGARPGPPPCDVDVPVAAPDPLTDDLLRGGLGS